MKHLLLSPKFISITLAVIALVIIPLTLIQIQSQQSLSKTLKHSPLDNKSIRQVLICAEKEVIITVTVTNTESRASFNSHECYGKDQQTGKSVQYGLNCWRSNL